MHVRDPQIAIACDFTLDFESPSRWCVFQKRVFAHVGERREIETREAVRAYDCEPLLEALGRCHREIEARALEELNRRHRARQVDVRDERRVSLLLEGPPKKLLI